MKFGAIKEEQLSSMDLHLPPEPESNAFILPGKRLINPKVYIGGAIWGSASWGGKIYPHKTPAARFRQLYPQHFNCIELNATHYNVYSPNVIREWAATAKGKDFRFCPKFPQQISHYSNFENTDLITKDFLESIRSFGDYLGPVFLQLSEHQIPVNRNNLYAYLATLPKDVSFFLELRHPLWFANMEYRSEVFKQLHALHMGAVITDTPGRRDIVHMQLAVPKIFVRFVCNALHASSFLRTDEWVKQIQSWIDRGMEEVYVILHPGNDAAVPELAAYWVKELNKYCDLDLSPPQSLQPLLF